MIFCFFFCFRPAGINVLVDFVPQGWLLGEAQLPGDDTTVDAISRIRSQTQLTPLLADST